ncbi:kinesin-like protein KIN-UB [Papaver somniferum]|uniref:kinesin-like protein KIN-UB n=1 Tax=Papaver somniferum TaxID=3469 RepID=UPI000E6F8852|nr:kinesin-like protein KIN-UB [Papaver somniferum]
MVQVIELQFENSYFTCEVWSRVSRPPSVFVPDKLQTELRAEGGIKALLGMARCAHPGVLAQVARGIADFAKCESRAATQGSQSGKSLLIDDGALPWIVQNANTEAPPVRHYIEFALCHLAQNEVNAKDMISGGALWELLRISRDSSRADVRTTAHRILTSSPIFQAEVRRLRIECKKNLIRLGVLAQRSGFTTPSRQRKKRKPKKTGGQSDNS